MLPTSKEWKSSRKKGRRGGDEGRGGRGPCVHRIVACCEFCSARCPQRLSTRS